MTTKTKVIAAVALAAIGGGVYWKLRKKTPGARIELGEYNLAGCDCYRYDWMSDGTKRSTKVDRSFCSEDLAFAGCDGAVPGAALVASARDWFGSMFGGAV